MRTPPASASRTATVPRRSVTSAASKLPLDDVGNQRIYHLTHVDNLAGVLAAGSLFADANDGWGSRPAVDISSPETRLTRRAAPLGGPDSPSVASYVPFFLSPNSAVWECIRSGEPDHRLVASATGSAPSDFVMLISTVKQARDGLSRSDETDPAQIAVTDGDAAHVLTRFGITPDDADRVLRRLRADDESPAIHEAEFLVADAFPFELVSLIGVANDRARDVVKAILKTAGHRPKVAVYPPWFHPAALVEQ